MAVKAIPEGYHTVTPYLIVNDAATVLEFAAKAFDAQERFRFDTSDGKIGHAEVQIGDSVVMVADASTSDQGQHMQGVLHLYVENMDELYQRALDAGATSIREPADQFYGDRTAGVRDAAGNHWWLSTHIEDVSPEEMERRAREIGSMQGS